MIINVDGMLKLDAFRWGLVPFWAKDLKIGYSMINARADTVTEKPAFKHAFKQRRCLIPADGFYEWKKVGADKQPYRIMLQDQQIFSMAGLWETWNSPEGEKKDMKAYPVSKAVGNVKNQGSELIEEI